MPTMSTRPTIIRRPHRGQQAVRVPLAPPSVPPLVIQVVPAPHPRGGPTGVAYPPPSRNTNTSPWVTILSAQKAPAERLSGKTQFCLPEKLLRDAFLAQNTILSAQKAPAGRLSDLRNITQICFLVFFGFDM